ncbi:MAG: thrombospondin type 3 repeat-containing protein [Acidimicrobiia bacterium]
MARSAILVLGLISLLTASSAHAFEVFQDPNAVGEVGASPVTVPIGPPVAVNLYYRALGTASADPGTVCVTGEGAEVCAWDVHITGLGGMTLDSFTPVGDIVANISGNVLRFNGGDPLAGELSTSGIPMGTLMVSASAPGSAEVTGNLFVTAALSTSSVTTGVVLATTSAPDGDSDGVPDASDNCPTISNGTQDDGDADLVGDACDNCVFVANPRRDAAYLAANTWATLTGSQRDDDVDGYGNKCDADFNQSNFAIGGPDITEFSASIGKAVSSDLCGTSGTDPCAIYDLDETGLATGGPDITALSAQIGTSHSATKRCPTCPLDCTEGGAGNCP